MRSTIDVYNTALARLGGNQFNRENSPDGDGTEATLCRTLFPHALDISLAHSEWGFAKRTVALALKADFAPENPDYPFRYALPADCVRPMRLQREGGGGSVTEDIPYEIDGQDIVAAVSPAVLVYVRRASDPATWPPAFADAVAWALASELATALVNDPNRQQFYGEQARRALIHAAAIERNSQRALRKASPWVASRQ